MLYLQISAIFTGKLQLHIISYNINGRNGIYRVAQNKIPHQTLFPLHLNYTTILMCKTITMKITVFTGIATNCSDFIGKDEWPPNSPNLNPLDYHVWGAMLECYKTFQLKPNSINELKKVLQTIWDDLPQNSINKAILSFIKRLRACV